MISVERLDGQRVLVNAELIEMVEAHPDTVISLAGGNKVLVRDSLDAVRDKVVAYRARIVSEAQGRPKGNA